MGQRVQHSASCILTMSHSKAVFTVTMKDCFISVCFVILVCRAAANFPCKPEQIHWNSTAGKKPKCLDCPDCPPGSEPSVPCGTSVIEFPDIHCVLCKLGKTFSDTFDKAQCKACTICSKGKAFKNNCTLSTNTKCDNKCGNGFYTVHLISSCLPCTQCCGDGKDELATECINNKKKCKVRSTPCTRVHTPSKQSQGNNSTSSTTTQRVPSESDITTTTVKEEEKPVSADEVRISIAPTWSFDNETLNGKDVESEKQDGTSIVVILFMVALTLCLVIFILVIIKKIIHLKNTCMLRSSRNLNTRASNTAQGRAPPRPHSSASYQSGQESASPLLGRSESPQLNESASAQPNISSEPDRSALLQTNRAQPDEYESPQSNGSASPQLRGSVSSQSNGPTSGQFIPSAQKQSESNSGEVTLEQLEKNYLPVFDWMCKELDIRKRGTRWDFESLASQYNNISLTIRNSLKNEFQNERGSPSDVLMSHIKTQYPNLPLRHLVGNLQTIGRNDIAQGLMPYIVQKSSMQEQRL